MLPKTLKNFNVFLDGVSLLGEAEEITLPTLTRKTEEYEGGGMLGAVDLDLGQEKMEMEITFKGWNLDVMKHYGVFSADGVALRFRGAVRSESSEADTDAVEISVRGRLTEIDFGTAKKAEGGATKIKVPLTWFKYEVNGDSVIEIDVINLKFVVNGEDRLADERRAIGAN